MSKTNTHNTHRSVLISGASIAGPALAYWLNHYGFDVTVVERASAIRSGGYPIDIRGTALDVVVGADGMHSNTRRVMFGPEEPFRRDLGYSFSIFSMPNELGLSHGAIIYSEPGRTAVVLAVRDSPELFGMLAFATEKPGSGTRFNAEEQIERTAQVFASGGWQVPRLVEAMRRADDLYFDTVSQIRMPYWSKGRVGLVGDSAFAPSFLSGQGTSLAIVGAYVLAGELASHADPADALVSYERIARPFVEANQDLALQGGPSLLLRTQEQLDTRNRWLASLANGDVPKSQNDSVRQVHNSLRLPDYER